MVVNYTSPGALEQKRAIADALRSKKYGTHPLSGLSKIMDGYMYGRMMRDAKDAEQGNMDLYRQEMMKLMRPEYPENAVTPASLEQFGGPGPDDAGMYDPSAQATADKWNNIGQALNQERENWMPTHPDIQNALLQQNMAMQQIGLRNQGALDAALARRTGEGETFGYEGMLHFLPGNEEGDPEVFIGTTQGGRGGDSVRFLGRDGRVYPNIQAYMENMGIGGRDNDIIGYPNTGSMGYGSAGRNTALFESGVAVDESGQIQDDITDEELERGLNTVATNDWEARVTSVREAAENSKRRRFAVEQMLSLYDEGLRTGWGREFLLPFQTLAEQLGFKTDQNVPAAEQFRALARREALMIRNPDSGMGLPGAASNLDLKFLSEAVAALNRTEDGNRMLMEFELRMIDMNEKLEEKMHELQNRDDLNGAERSQALSDWLQQQRILSDEERAQISEITGIQYNADGDYPSTPAPTTVRRRFDVLGAEIVD